ncbi:YaaC family protein [Amycolatopsis sp. NBC_00438]|uniref:YaaC family protein n=1 Tax=Amycolatopsis sp. NBC_00438 TaxID=2903558 RepID=UPI002E1B3D11
MQDNLGETAWDELRETRWHPPGAASTDRVRAATYVSALEQAEQMFRAAAVVGTSTRPLQVFYGLSQAGRAIAAASTLQEWELKGHGIASTNLSADLPSVGVATDKPSSAGSFVRLSALLGSPVWGKAPVSLNELWDTLPENERAPLADRGDARRTPLWMEHRNLWDEPHPLASVPVVGFPPRFGQGNVDRAMLDGYLAAFPGVRDYHSYVNVQRDPHLPAMSVHVDGWSELTMNWQVQDGTSVDGVTRLKYLKSMSRSYLGRLYFFPTVGANVDNLHPLMTWWAVLHTLSMLARYQPGEWATHIDVDASRYATAIERLLRRALHVVPRLVLETLRQVTP